MLTISGGQTGNHQLLSGQDTNPFYKQCDIIIKENHSKKTGPETIMIWWEHMVSEYIKTKCNSDVCALGKLFYFHFDNIG